MDDLVRFGAFELDLRTGELRSDGVVRALERQPARVLTLLVSRAGHLVPRDELRAHVWGPDTYVDFDRGLNYCIRQIRATLADDAKAPTFIETIPRQGYRFIAPLESKEDVAPRKIPKAALIRYCSTAAAGAVLAAVLIGPSAEHPARVLARNERHHAAAVALATTMYEIVFRTSFDATRHQRALSVLRAAHDLVF